MIFALSDGAWAAIAAGVAAVGGVAAAYAANIARREVANRIGTPNGDGNVVQMLTTLLNGQAGQDARIARLEGIAMQQGIDLAAQDTRLRELEHPSPTPTTIDTDSAPATAR